MTPATSSQMSRSSSTIKISSAMIFSVLSNSDAARHRFGLTPITTFSPFPALAGQRPQTIGMQGQRHARLLPRRLIRAFHLAIMLFADLLDDCEAMPGAAQPRRPIWFGARVGPLRQP